MTDSRISLSSRRGAAARPGALFLAAALAAATVRGDALEDALRSAREACRRAPASVAALDRLAALELRSYRATHAAETLEAARAAADRALALAPRDFDARRFRAAANLVEHRFSDVERDASALHAERPADADVLGMIADAQMESGRYPEALATIQEMVNRRPGLPAYSRVSYAREIHGDLAGALSAMDMAIAAGDPADPEATAWCLARSGLLCRKLGRTGEAAERFEHARSLYPRSPYAWEGIGWTARARGDFASAQRAFRKAFEIVPWPQYAVELRETAEAAGRADAVRRWDAVLAAIERMSDAAGLFNRVLALWEADHGDPARAVAMAEAELAARKDVYGWDAYAWALYRRGRISEAAGAERQALARGTQDPLLDAHAGLIFAAAGDGEASGRLENAVARAASLPGDLAAEAKRRLAALPGAGPTGDAAGPAGGAR